MNTRTLWKWSLGVCLAVLPLAGCGQRRASDPGPVVVYNQETTPVPLAPIPVATNWNAGDDIETNGPPPEAAEESLENAPAQIVAPAQAPSNALSASAAEIIKLAQAGVDEGVMLAYVTNSPNAFQLTSDDIVYLNDVGVSGAVVTAMIQRDQALGVTSNAAMASAPSAYTNQLVPAAGAPTPYATNPTAEVQPEATPVIPDDAQQAANVSYTYFYDSLSPYGSWINVAGYGLCWQPTVVVANRDWQPYCDRGRWVYSDCGWYWASDYSWGWAPFHYGRWFHHNRWGWCWAPDTVWGPSWVSWRYTSDYCGWAPLPPSACYRPGLGFTYYGRSVGFNFSFGLNSRHYAFVPIRNFYDRHPGRYRVRGNNVTQIYNHTTIVQRYDRGDNGRVINHGIPVDRVRSVTRANIRPIQIRDTDRPTNAHLQRGQQPGSRTLNVFRPALPQPEGRTRLVGEGVRPARHDAIRPATLAAPTGRSDSAGNPSSTRRDNSRPDIRPNTIHRQNPTTPVSPANPIRRTTPTAPPTINSPVQNSPTPVTPRRETENPSRGNDADHRVPIRPNVPQTRNPQPILPNPNPPANQPPRSTPPVRNNVTPAAPQTPVRPFTPIAPRQPNTPNRIEAPRQRSQAPSRQETVSSFQPSHRIETRQSAPLVNTIERPARIERPTPAPAPRIETRQAPPRNAPAIQRPSPSRDNAPRPGIRSSPSARQDRNDRRGR